MKKVTDSAIVESVLTSVGSLSAAAVRLGVSRTTLYRRIQQSDAIRKAITQAQDTAIQAAALALADACETAVTVLVTNMNDETLPATVRTSSADAVLRHCSKYIELSSVIRRLDALERMVNTNENQY